MGKYDNFKYLMLVEVDESPFLVLADIGPPADSFVAFSDGAEVQLGKIVNSCFISLESSEYEMFSALYPVFEAVKIYGCCYEKEAGDG